MHMNTLTRAQKAGLTFAEIGCVFIALGGPGDRTVQKLMPSHEASLGVAPGAAPPALEQLFLALYRSQRASNAPFLDPGAHFPGGRFGRGMASNFAAALSCAFR
jgi:hypothetical protein